MTQSTSCHLASNAFKLQFSTFHMAILKEPYKVYSTTKHEIVHKSCHLYILYDRHCYCGINSFLGIYNVTNTSYHKIIYIVTYTFSSIGHDQ